jgi:bacteriocin-like protein
VTFADSTPEDNETADSTSAGELSEAELENISGGEGTTAHECHIG